MSQKGISYYEKKKEYEKKIDEIASKKQLIKNELVKLASGDAPLLIVKDQVTEILDQSKNFLENQNKSEYQKNTNSKLSEG